MPRQSLQETDNSEVILTQWEGKRQAVQSSEFLDFVSDWVINKTHLTVDVHQFLKNTKEFQESELYRNYLQENTRTEPVIVPEKIAATKAGISLQSEFTEAIIPEPDKTNPGPATLENIGSIKVVPSIAKPRTLVLLLSEIAGRQLFELRPASLPPRPEIQETEPTERQDSQNSEFAREPEDPQLFKLTPTSLPPKPEIQETEDSENLDSWNQEPAREPKDTVPSATEEPVQPEKTQQIITRVQWIVSSDQANKQAKSGSNTGCSDQQGEPSQQPRQQPRRNPSWVPPSKPWGLQSGHSNPDSSSDSSSSSWDMSLERGKCADMTFSPQQMAQLREMMIQTVKTVINNQLAKRGEPDPAGPPGPTGYRGGLLFKYEDISLFNPDKTSKTEKDKGGILQIDWDLYFTDVLLFTEKIWDMAMSWGAEPVRTLIPSCLQGSASLWYNSELTELEKAGLWSDQDGVRLWCKMLEKRFKFTASMSLKALISLNYTPQDVKDGKRPGTYVSQTVWLAKVTGFDKMEQQLLFCWNHIDPELRQFISKLNKETKVINFIEVLEDLKETWELKY